jgi:hypothetical protein
MLAGAVQLTKLTIAGVNHDDDSLYDPYRADVCLEAGILANKTLLQYLYLGSCQIVGGAAGVAHLLSPLVSWHQLTYLNLINSLPEAYVDIPPAAYSSITASSKLQTMDLSDNTLPTGVWQHNLPVGMQLANLVSLVIFDEDDPSGDDLPAPECSQFVSCCPGLQELNVTGLYDAGLYNTEVLTPLRGLSGLYTLSLENEGVMTVFVDAVCQLTRLRELELNLLDTFGVLPPALLQLTMLQALTNLTLKHLEEDVTHTVCGSHGEDHRDV